MTMYTAAEQLFLEYKLEEAFAAFQELAEAGNGRAMYFLGEYYDHGYTPAEEDEKRAEDWYRKGMEAGDALAELAFALALPEEDPDRARHFRKVWETVLHMAEAGDVFARYAAADTCWRGDMVPQDKEKAMQWYLESASEGLWQSCQDIQKEDSERDRALGQLLISISFEDRDLLWTMYRKGFVLAAERGLPEAQMRLGEDYENGFCVDRDLQKALAWYKKAADAGLVKAQVRLGDLYSLVEEVGIDGEEAKRWYLKAADQGYIQAQTYIGEMYFCGTGTEQNIPLALEWYRKAAAQGDGRAEYQLARYYWDTDNADHDLRLAVEWYKKAADHGIVDAWSVLGWCYWEGIVVDQDYAEAVKWYRKAAKIELDMSDSAYYLGEAYRCGYGVKKDSLQALDWYIKAVVKNSVFDEEKKAKKAILHMFEEAKAAKENASAPSANG